MRWVWRSLALVLALVIMLPVAVMVGLNTGAGRNFAMREINQLAAGKIHITGLAGHFPADIKLAHLAVADDTGIWLTGDAVELRWRPLALLSRDVAVTALTAGDISVRRAPVTNSTSTNNASTSLPDLKIDVDRLAVGALNLGPSLAGQATTLKIAASVHLKNAEQGNVQLNAQAAGGQGQYQVTAAVDPETVDTSVQINEPPDGLLGHFAGPQVHDPLHVTLTLQGKRDDAALNFAAALGAAQLNGQGHVGLNPASPHADVTISVPSLAPLGALAAQNIAGHTSLHIIISQQHDAAHLAVDGTVALDEAPGPVAKLIGQQGHVALVANFANNQAVIDDLAVTGTGLTAAAHGTIAAAGFQLVTHLGLSDVSMLSPGIKGALTADAKLSGVTNDFSLNGELAGNVAERSVPSGPFAITIAAQNLPHTPSGTLTGTGTLENFPLQLNAQFARDAAGVANIVVSHALWRSLSANADIALAPGAMLPTGTAKFAVKNLGDFRQFSPVPLSGAVEGNFSHQTAQDFTLNVNARNLLVAPAIGSINAAVNAKGPISALAVTFNATIAKLLGYPAQVTSQAVVNLDAQSANIAAFTASWRQVNAKLLGLALVSAKPGIAVRHFALGVNGGVITADGVLSPALNIQAGIKNLPANLASLAAPDLKASGTLSATAAITGSIARPVGTITLDAANIKLHTGPAAALPAANLTATASLAGQTANVNAKLGVGDHAKLAASGLVPLNASGKISVHITGTTDLRLLDPILAAGGTVLRGVVTPDITITGTSAKPLADGSVTLAGGSLSNIGSGLSLTNIAAHINAAGRMVNLQDISATAGAGTITGHGDVDLGTPDMPINLAIKADNASPIASDLLSENIDAALTLTGGLRRAMALGGTVTIRKANINIPKSLPPSVANLPILNRGEKPPPAPPPPPDINLDVRVAAKNQIFIRGDGLFAEVGGKLHLTGTAANPAPNGGFTLQRGSFALAGKTLQFTKGIVSFNGNGFIPTLDLEATTTLSNSNTVSLVVGGTAAKPTITLSGSPPLPSDEVLSELLFGQATASLSPFQAASLAAALASLSGVGGSAISDPLGGVRNALGLDELSLGGSGSGAPSVQAGRYVAPGVYVGAQQSTSGQGTQATVQINLYKGLKLNTATGTSGSGSGNSSSVGLTYQFNY